MPRSEHLALKTLKQRHWLELAEYFFLAVSGVGIITAAMSKPAIYAAAPVTISIALNLANRQRIEQAICLCLLLGMNLPEVN